MGKLNHHTAFKRPLPPVGGWVDAIGIGAKSRQIPGLASPAVSSFVDADAPVSYVSDGRVATVTMDDGKVNVFSIPMLRALHAAFDRAEAERVVVVLAGREGYFSAGFDLKVFQQDQAHIIEMLTLGATMAERILAFPTPVVTACTGHAYPAGAFLLMSADLRLGAEGPFRIGTNEVRIGLTMPWFAIEIARHRLAPAYFDRCLITSVMCGPQEAVTAGFLDQVVPGADLAARAHEAAEDLAQLDFAAHVETKLRVRAKARQALRAAIESDLAPRSFTAGHPAPDDQDALPYPGHRDG